MTGALLASPDEADVPEPLKAALPLLEDALRGIPGNHSLLVVQEAAGWRARVHSRGPVLAAPGIQAGAPGADEAVRAALRAAGISASVQMNGTVVETILDNDEAVVDLALLLHGQVAPEVTAARSLAAVLDARSLGRPARIAGVDGRIEGLQLSLDEVARIRPLLGNGDEHWPVEDPVGMYTYAPMLGWLLESALGGTITVAAYPARAAICSCDTSARNIFTVSPLSCDQADRLVALLETL
ncbi:MAG: hypothetical protein LBV60_21135 [Streptomyces sp.]|jgi:hypothetical protein|nr:hypothetical protein [Streptomyces sp.]